MSTDKPLEAKTISRNQYKLWRDGCQPLWQDFDRAHLHIEPDCNISALHEALTATLARLLAFECSLLQGAIDEGY